MNRERGGRARRRIFFLLYVFNQFFSLGVVFHSTSDKAHFSRSLSLSFTLRSEFSFSTFVYRFFDFKKFIFIDFSWCGVLICFPLKFLSLFLACLLACLLASQPRTLFLLWRICYIYHIMQHLITSISHRCSIFFTILPR